LIGLERPLGWLHELILLLDHGQPEGGNCIVVVAASMAMALDHRLGAELLQTGARGDKVLSNASNVVQGGLQIRLRRA